MSTKALLYLTFVLGVALVGSGCAAPIVYKQIKKKKDSKKSEETTSQQQEGQKP